MKKTSYFLIASLIILISCRKKEKEPIPISPNFQPVVEAPLPPVAMKADKKDGIAVKPETDSVGSRRMRIGKDNYEGYKNMNELLTFESRGNFFLII